jgi:hypothetical protein
MILVYMIGITAMRLSYDDWNSMEKTLSKILLPSVFFPCLADGRLLCPELFVNSKAA